MLLQKIGFYTENTASPVFVLNKFDYLLFSLFLSVSDSITLAVSPHGLTMVCWKLKYTCAYQILFRQYDIQECRRSCRISIAFLVTEELQQRI